MFIPCLYLLPGLTQFPWTLSPPKVSAMQILRRFAVHPPGHRPSAIAALEVDPYLRCGAGWVGRALLLMGRIAWGWDYNVLIRVDGSIGGAGMGMLFVGRFAD